MESKMEELKKLGIDISTIITGTSNPKLLERFHKLQMYGDVVIPEWTDDDIATFSNKIYSIVIKYKKE